MVTVLYFSYGSNMSSKRLQHRVSNIRLVNVGRLEQHKLEFHKKSKDGSSKCDAVYVGNDKQFIYGAVYELTVSQLRILDMYEGLGAGYEQKTVDIITPDLGILNAITYYATDIDNSLQPYIWYKEHVIRGANEHNLPSDYIEILKSINAIPDTNKLRHQEEMMIY